MRHNTPVKSQRSAHLVLVRHGESIWNKKGLWTGWQDIPLSKIGKKEARAAGKILSDIRFDMAFTSDLSRAHETLNIIKEELGHLDLPTIKHHAYKERHYGIYTGKSKWKIKKNLGEEKFRKLRRGWNTPIPQGESLKDVFDRVVPHFRENVMPFITKGCNVLIVAHGNTHRALIKYLEKLSHEDITEIEMQTGEVIVYKLDPVGIILKKERRNVINSSSFPRASTELSRSQSGNPEEKNGSRIKSGMTISI